MFKCISLYRRIAQRDIRRSLDLNTGGEAELFSKILSGRDALRLLELTSLSLLCKNESDFRKLEAALHNLIPYDFAVCGISRLGNHAGITHDIINISYPSEWLLLYLAREYYLVDPILKRNFYHFQLQHWTDTYKCCPPPEAFLSAARDFGLSEGYSHGAKSPHRNEGSVFSIAGPSIERNRRTEIILEYIIPHLHQALSRVFNPDKTTTILPISTQEKEVLKWVKLGKSNPEISTILGISENTVKYHLKVITRKFDVRTRVQAIAVALEQGVIGID